MENDSQSNENEEKENILEEIKGKYYKGKKIGEGHYGQCFEFISIKDEKEIYAGKIIDKDKLKGEKSLENIINEIKIQNSLDYPKIVKVKDKFEDDKNVFIVLELCQNNTLRNLIQKRGHLTEIEVQCYMFQIIQGLKYMHYRKIIHRDLKPENIFIDDKLDLKIGDLGYAVKLNSIDEKRKSLLGTIFYSAPEVIDRKNYDGYSFKADIWSLGVIMYNLLTGRLPFFDSNDKIYEKIIDGSFSFPDDIEIGKVAKDLITQILEVNPKKRPDLNQILSHDFFHMNKFPKSLSLKDEIKNESNFDKNDFDKYKDKSEIKGVELYKLPTQNIEEVKYEDIDKYIFRNAKGPKYWVTFFHNSSKKFSYYEIKKEIFGIYFNDKESTNILYKKNNNKYYNVIVEESGEDKIIEFDKEKCPENLVKRLNIFIDYMDLASKKIKNDKIIYPKSDENEDKDEINENSGIFYIRKYFEEKSTFILYLSNGAIQLNFRNSLKIILPPNGKDVIMFIDKFKNIWNIENINIMNNSNKDLVQGIKFFREFEIKLMKKKLKNNKNL